MCCCCATAFLALMRRNLIYRKRNIFGSIFEFLLPVGFICILVAIKVALEGGSGFSPEVIPADFPTDEDTILPLTFRDYVTSVQAPRVCELQQVRGKQEVVISGILFNQNPFLKCDSRKCVDIGEDASKTTCEYLILAVAPDNAGSTRGMARADRFMTYVDTMYPEFNSTGHYAYDMVQMFSSSEAIEDYVTDPNYGKTTPKVAFAVVFSDGTSEKDYAYTLRANSTNFNIAENDGRPATTTSPDTSRKFSDFAFRDDVCTTIGGTPELDGINDASCTYQYLFNGAITIQRLVNDWILADTGSTDLGYGVSEHGVQFVRFPSREYVENGFYEQINPFAPLLMLLGLLYPVSAIIRSITLEKQLRQKELLKMMGVTETDIGGSWFMSYFLFHLITAIVSTIASTYFYAKSAGFLLFIFWFLSYTSVVFFSMLLAAPFTKSTNATLVGLLIFFAGYFLTLAADFETGSTGVISLVSLHPVAAISYGMQEIGRLEDAAVGVTMDTFNSTDSPSGYTFQNSIGSLFVDCIIWGILGWYFNRVLRSDFGQPLPWYFPFTLSYWCPGSGSAPATSAEDDAIDDSVPVEPVTDALKGQISQGLGIDIRGLRKQFGEKTAVDGLRLSMYSGQVTALLGHNGAGKTTTIAMLTGMLAPTSGYAVVAGKDIRTDMNQIRQEIGICLQHDCLFPQLTVEEHIQFFSRLKGLYEKHNKEEIATKIKQSIEDVALYEKRNTLSKNLSGGMKRKLSVAIAFCGDSKTVLLDEPTSGMDPFSRRFTWNVIRQYRQDRCIILTTHFMDEADILGDRIAIMAEGQLRCAGSSLFLKRHYGVGYQLTIEKQAETGKYALKNEEGGAVEVETGKHQFDDHLKSIVTGSVTEANLLSNVGTEMSFQLPIGAASSFVPMFEKLDSEVESESIVTYGVSITTLDEVFLLVARGETGDRKEFQSSQLALGDGMVQEDDKSSRSGLDLENDGLFLRHVQSLFQKRALNFKRDKKAWVCSTILPSVFVLIGFLLFRFSSPQRNLDPLVLTLADFNPTVDTSPRNPIPFNAPDQFFECQPGICLTASDYPPVDGQDGYSFCGNGFFGLASSCLITESDNVVSRITEEGASPVPEEAVSKIVDTSIRLFNTSTMFVASQYGALQFTHDTMSVTANNESYNDFVVASCQGSLTASNSAFMTPEHCQNYRGVGYVVSYNFTSYHGSLLYQGLADEALVREANDDGGYTISTTIHPLPITDQENSFGQSQDAFTAWFLVVLSFPFISGTFATFIVNEKASKAKHLQTVAGVNPLSYWLSSYFWDIMNYQFPLWSTVVLMFIFDVSSLTATERDVASGVIISLILFGPASAGFTYCITFFFTSASMCNLVVILLNFIIGMAGPLVSLILRIIGNPGNGDEDTSLVTAADTIDWVLRFIPSFNLGSSLFKIINIEFYALLEEDPDLSVWSPAVILYETIFQVVWCFVFISLAVMLDIWSSNPAIVSRWQAFTKVITCRCFSAGGQRENVQAAIADDDDVISEQDRVLGGGANDDLIVLNQLTKQYDNGKIAVNHLSLGIPPGQCFGLLGINGAGKTTTMAMLTAEFPPTSGDATLAGFSVSNEPEKTRRRIGYCPQFDAHFQNMTGREHVSLYAAIKGVPREMVNDAVEKKLAEVGLSEFDSNRLSSGYSGGMKRKLSVACATIGQPQIVFLDEPSTGMDPVARRDLWAVISEMVTGGNIPSEDRTSVILTTHSMEECEALCPRIGIMANGKLRCLGSAQHLKTRFGQGFQVEMKVKVVDHSDSDYSETITRLASLTNKELHEDVEEGVGHDIFLNLAEVTGALRSLTNDDSLSSKVAADNPNGYLVYKNASSPVGCALDEVASFAVAEIRMMNVDKFFSDNFEVYILRERQDNKARYEVGSEGVKISTIFGKIEEAKDSLMVADYGVSQTSLEQVFNMHAAEAEKLKHGRNDG